MGNLSGLIIALTGGGSGLGLGLSRYLVGQGAKLAIMEIVPSKVESLRNDFGNDVLVCQGDVRETDDIVAFHDAVLARFGGVDALIGAQGIFDGGQPLKDIPLDQVDATFDEVMHVNLRGYIKSAKIFRESLAKRNGAIVLTGSSAGSYAADGGGLFYTASKHGVLGVVRQLAFEFSPDVRVNAVSPGGIANSDLRGPQSLGLQGASQGDIPKDKFMEMIEKVMLLKFLPTGEDYGPIYALLASPDSKTMTGEIIMADQGLMNRPIISGNNIF